MDSPPSACFAAPTSDLAQLLSSLGVSTSSTPIPSSSHSPTSTGPDPLLVARSRLTSLKASIEYGTRQLKAIAAITPLYTSSGAAHIAIRISPPITTELVDQNGTKQPPTFVALAELEGGEVELACDGVETPGVCYAVYDSKQASLLAVKTMVTGLIDHFESLRSELVKEAKDRIEDTMQAAQAVGVVAQTNGSASTASSTAVLSSTEAQPTTLVDEDGRVLNEEGLPFVDLNETVTDNPDLAQERLHGSGSSSRAALADDPEPEGKLSGEERKRWIESVFSRFGEVEDEEAEEVQEVQEEELKDDAAYKSPPTGHREAPPKLSVSDLRPSHLQSSPSPKSSSKLVPSMPSVPSIPRPPTDTAPLKSVLKPTPPAMMARPSFGSTGIRRGFLNMNPSSPAAIHSSDPMDSGQDIASEGEGAETRGRLKRSEEEILRMSRSEELPARSPPAAAESKKEKTKKSVRIQSPGPASFVVIPSEGDDTSIEATASTSQLASTPTSSTLRRASKLRHQEEDTVSLEAEAARILSLLGPEVVQGTPAGDEALRKLRVEEQERQAQIQAEVVRGIREERKREAERSKEQRPAMSLQVKERTRGTATESSGNPGSAKVPSQTKVSTFKRGFLNATPTKSPSSSARKVGAPESALPRDLKSSLGISALDRSLISDAPLAAEREVKGLPVVVPHARPSKAYAEKLEGKQRPGTEISAMRSKLIAEGNQVVDTGSEDGSRVRFKLAEAIRTGQDDDDQQRQQVEKETAIVDHRQRLADLEDREAERAHHESTLVELQDEEEGFVEIDEHDEEAFARAAYASGDHSDDEDGLESSKLRRRFDLFVDDDDDEDGDDEHGLDWGLEGEDGYDPDGDQDENDPSDLVTDLETAELARSYALAKSQQMTSRSQMSQEQRINLERAVSGELSRGRGLEDEQFGGDLWSEEEIDGRDLSSVLDPGDAAEREGAGPNARMSRFRASRIVKALGMGQGATGSSRSPRSEAGINTGADEEERRADEAGHELAHLLQGATNIGPPSEAVTSPSASLPLSPGSAKSNGERGDHQAVPPVMILPSLTPLRFPRNTASVSSSRSRVEPLKEGEPLPREGVDLQGETDEDEKEDILLDIMRVRLQEKRHRQERKEARDQGEATAGGGSKGEGETKARKTPVSAVASTSGARRLLTQNRQEGDIGESGKAMIAPPSLLKSSRGDLARSTGPAGSTSSSNSNPPHTTSVAATPPRVADHRAEGIPAVSPARAVAAGEVESGETAAVGVERKSLGTSTERPVEEEEGKPTMSRFKAARLAASHP